MAASDQQVSRDDIERKLRLIKGEVESTAEAAKPAIAVVGGAVVVGVVLVAYLLGRRKGRKKTTIVEVRRV